MNANNANVFKGALKDSRSP